MLCATVAGQARQVSIPPDQVPSDWGVIALQNGGTTPGATGQARFTNVVYLGTQSAGPFLDPITAEAYWDHTYLYEGDLTVTCQRLDPKKQYSLINLRDPITGALRYVRPAADGTLWFAGRASASIVWRMTLGYWGEEGWRLTRAGCFVGVSCKTGRSGWVLSGTVVPPVIPDHP